MDRRTAPTALVVKLHQTSNGCLVHRFKPQNSRSSLDRALFLACINELRHQPAKSVYRQIAKPRRFGTLPGLELVTFDAEPFKKFPRVKIQGGLKLFPA